MCLAATGRTRALGAVAAVVVIGVVAWLGLPSAAGAQTSAQPERGPGLRPPLSPGPASVAPPAGAVPFSAGGDGTVEMTVVGTGGDLQRVRNVVESRSLAGPGARWTRVGRFDPMEILRGDRDSQSATLRCWIDVVDPRRARLYFAARSGQQFLVRDVEMSGTFDEVDREALSQVIELSVAALMENERAGLTRAQTQALLASREPAPARQPPPPQPSPEPPPPLPVVVSPPVADEPPGPPRLVGTGPTAGVFYRVQALGPDLPLVHGPGLAVAWGGLGPHGLLGVWAGGQYQLPAEEIGPAVGVRFETIAARGGLQAYLALDRVRGGNDDGAALAGLTGRLGAGADVVRVTPRPGNPDPSAALTSPRWSQSLVLGAAVALNWRLGRHLALAVAASIDVLPTAVHYDLDVGGQTSAAFSPWRARPGLALEAYFR